MDITRGDFYEDDEPVEKVIEAFDRGTKGLTEPPRGFTWSVGLTQAHEVLARDQSSENKPRAVEGSLSPFVRV